MKRSNGHAGRLEVSPLHDPIASSPFEGADIPELAREFPTALLTVSACFTVQHVISELRYQLEFDQLVPNDLALLVQLGQLAAAKLANLED